MLAQLLPANLFAAFLIFARIGSAMMLLPGFGEFYVLQRFRLLLALLVSLLLIPVLAPVLPPLPESVTGLLRSVGVEAMIGIFLGTVARILLSGLDTAGSIVSYQLGLSQAQIFNPSLQTQGTLTGSFYSVLGVLLIFLTDLHHLLLRALVDSYGVFAPTVVPELGDLSESITRSVAGAFEIALELAAPFVVLGVVFSVGIGLLGRLVPQLQILFVTQPLQIIGGLLALGLALSAGMHWFLATFAERFAALTGT
jgi:flagellar biosynthetic protein FliR